MLQLNTYILKTIVTAGVAVPPQSYSMLIQTAAPALACNFLHHRNFYSFLSNDQQQKQHHYQQQHSSLHPYPASTPIFRRTFHSTPSHWNVPPPPPPSTAMAYTPVSDTLDMSYQKQQVQQESSSSVAPATKRFKFLNDDAIAKIRQDARVDAQGFIQAENIEAMLLKYPQVFTPEEASLVSDVFYAGKAGGKVAIDDFIAFLDSLAENVKNAASKDFTHFKLSRGTHPLGISRSHLEFIGTDNHSHDLYTKEELDVKLTHVQPPDRTSALAFTAVKMIRKVFDTFTLWNVGEMTHKKILKRAIFLETIAGVPGFVGGMLRHLKSLRAMERDGGWIQTLLEEAENERMHLLTFIKLYQPGTFFRLNVILAQGIFANIFFLAYLASPKFCHRMVGYIEEEACHTYTKILKAIDEAPQDSPLAKWATQTAPAIGRAYWHLGENGNIRDLMEVVRADEANHRDVNHTFANLNANEFNPYADNTNKVDLALAKYIKNVINV